MRILIAGWTIRSVSSLTHKTLPQFPQVETQNIKTVLESRRIDLEQRKTRIGIIIHRKHAKVAQKSNMKLTEGFDVFTSEYR